MFILGKKYLLEMSDGRTVNAIYTGTSNYYNCCVCGQEHDTMEFLVHYTKHSSELFIYCPTCLPIIHDVLSEDESIYNYDNIFNYTNPHPNQVHTTDCVLRAFAIALEKDYLEIRKALNKQKREMGYNSYKDNKFVNKILSKYNSYTFRVVKGQPRIKGFDFVKHFPTGRYILSMGNHVVACIDGIIKDTWDSTRKAVYKAYKIEDNPTGSNEILSLVGTDFYNIKN